MHFPLLIAPPLSLSRSQVEIEHCAFSRCSLGLYPPALAIHDALHRGQAYAYAGKLALCMQALEWLEQL
jgi:hypothetical protein